MSFSVPSRPIVQGDCYKYKNSVSEWRLSTIEGRAILIKKRRQRRRKPVAEPVIVTAEPKTVMQLIFESQRAQLERLNEGPRSKVTG